MKNSLHTARSIRQRVSHRVGNLAKPAIGVLRLLAVSAVLPAAIFAFTTYGVGLVGDRLAVEAYR